MMFDAIIQSYPITWESSNMFKCYGEFPEFPLALVIASEAFVISEPLDVPVVPKQVPLYSAKDWDVKCTALHCCQWGSMGAILIRV